jgi:flagellar motor switch/type III secretory pathway protein FliN
MPESKPQAGETPAGPVAGQEPMPRLGSRYLPQYTRSLLRIQVPVLVTLAQKRQPLGRIVGISPGAILQFDKSCEEMLDLLVGERRIASGEAVKVGDKFGLRITSITPPDERYYPLGTL